MTSAFVQVWTPPQWLHVNFRVLTLAALQSFWSIVFPVSVSLEVEGQRTSKVLILGAGVFGRGRGGSK
jgi:hypothetical protein